MIHEKQFYENIVFMQGNDADEAMEILDLQGQDALLEYLLQWDTGAGALSETPPWGTGDHQVIFPEKDTHLVLSHNTSLSYCGLCRVINGGE
jgi:hypothetical protein